jgi:putative pyruvate formate lyase activating enzyme
MPDMKYGSADLARKYSRVRDYVRVNQAAVREMHRQVGDLVIDDAGVARRGLLVRHLVLPRGIAGTKEVLRFLAEEISPDTYVNIMGQYHPDYRAGEVPELARPVEPAEVTHAAALAAAYGLTRLDRRRSL